MILTKKHLARRTFLRGLGTTLALPLLDAMIPAMSGATTGGAAASPIRLGFVYVPNGIIQSKAKTLGCGHQVDARSEC